jgi:integrase
MASIFTRRWVTAAGQERYAYIVKYTVDGRDKRRQFTNKKRAHAFAESVNRAKKEAADEKAISVTPTIKEVADDWIAACERGREGALPLEPETIKLYKGYIRNHIGPFPIDNNETMGELRIGALRRSHVRKFRDYLLTGGLSRLTARKILIALKSVISHAINEEHIDKDPSHKITIRVGGRNARKQIEIHTPAEMRKIIQTARELAESTNKRDAKVWTRYSLVIEILVYCGLRPSELRGLPRTAVRDDECKIHIYQRADRSGIIGPPKTPQGVRTLYVPEDLMTRLVKWLRTHNHELVFPCMGTRHAGRPMYIENMRKRMWEHVQLVAEVPVYNLYSTRHFFASRLIANGANVKEVSVLMGHADEAFTLKVYGHLFKDIESEERRRTMVKELL